MKSKPGETPPLSTYEETDTCPLPQAHGRLSQAHRLWHRLQAAYPSPDDFVLQLNAAVEGFRNVTFILQNEMKRIPNADVWYKGWQMQMRTDSVMRWLHDSRTKVVHKGDLATRSTAILRIHADWYGPHEVATFSVPPLVSTETLAATFARREDLKEPCGKSPILEVERRWVEDGLPDLEILAALSHCYGVLWQLLADGHTQAGLTMRDIHEGQHSGEPRSDLDNRPACMLADKEERTVHVDLGKSTLLKGGMLQLSKEGKSRMHMAQYDELVALSELCRTEISKYELTRDQALVVEAALLVSKARALLMRDKYHLTIAFVHAPEDRCNPVAFLVRDQHELYVAMRHLAEAMRVMGADQIVYISEIWLEDAARLEPWQTPSQSVSKKEGLVCMAATARGARECWCFPFSRRANNEIELDEQAREPISVSFLAPVFMMWEGLGPDERSARGLSTVDGANESLAPRIVEVEDVPITREPKDL